MVSGEWTVYDAVVFWGPENDATFEGSGYLGWAKFPGFWRSEVRLKSPNHQQLFFCKTSQPFGDVGVTQMFGNVGKKNWSNCGCKMGKGDFSCGVRNMYVQYMRIYTCVIYFHNKFMQIRILCAKKKTSTFRVLASLLTKHLMVSSFAIPSRQAFPSARHPSSFNSM